MDSKYKGIVYIVVSALFFALMNAFVRLSGDLPSIQKSLFRNLVAMVFALILLLKNKQSLKWKEGNLKYLVLRATFGTLGILCNFYAVDHLVLSDASMLNKMSPFFAIVFSYLILKEKANPLQWISVIVAFLGSLLIIKPTFSNMDLVPSLIGLTGGLGAGIAYTMVRVLGQRGENKSYIVFFFSAFSCVVTLPYVVLNFTPMTLQQTIFLLLAGSCACVGQFAITTAYCYAPAKEVSIYDYSQIIFSAIIGYFLFSQTPDGFSVLGYVVICSMALLMFFYNNGKLKLHNKH
jgi:drug/metabolite transporter (DMT)-like permease